MQPNSPDLANDLHKLEESYYHSLWSSSYWNTREPNEDEQARANKIMMFIEDLVLPEPSATKPYKILDLGCGRGWLTYLLGAFGDVIGADPVAASINKAKELFPEINFLLADSKGLLQILGPNYFDLIVSSEVIEHIEDTQKESFLNTIYSLLSPGGFAILTTPRGELSEKWEHANTDVQPMEQWISEVHLDQISQSAGFLVLVRDRIFIPGYIDDWKCNIASSRGFNRLISYPFGAKILGKLRYACSIYQIVLLKRTR